MQMEVLFGNIQQVVFNSLISNGYLYQALDTDGANHIIDYYASCDVVLNGVLNTRIAYSNMADEAFLDRVIEFYRLSARMIYVDSQIFLGIATSEEYAEKARYNEEAKALAPKYFAQQTSK